MKFLCLECDEPMKLRETTPPDRGSISLLYECPSCAHGIAMLTNPYETQVVASLGVEIGPEEVAGQTAPSPPPAAAEAEPVSKCPFSSVAQDALAAEAAAPAPPVATATPAEPSWTPEARERLQRIPVFVRPMAEKGIEKFARDRGYPRIDEVVLDEAKHFFGM